jgi:hypothetical protein
MENINLRISQQSDREISLDEYIELFKMLGYIENFSTHIKLNARELDPLYTIPKRERLKYYGGKVEFKISTINKNSPLFIDILVVSSILFDEILKLLTQPITFDKFIKFLEGRVYARKLSQEEKAQYYQEFIKIQKYNRFIRRIFLLFDFKNQ